MADKVVTTLIEQAPTGTVLTTVTEVDGAPAIPANARTAAYVTLVVVSSVSVFVSFIAGDWFDADTADKIVRTTLGINALIGAIAGGFGINYRPKK